MAKGSGVRVLFYFVFRVLAVAAVILSIIENNWMQVLISLLLVLLVFLPAILGDRKKTRPNILELTLLVLVYVSIYVRELTTLYETSVLWQIITQFITSIIIGAVGFALVVILNRESKSVVTLTPSFIALFSFCFAFSVGAMWELFEASMSYFFNIALQKLGMVIVRDIGVNLVGALTVSSIGYVLLRYNYKNIQGQLLDTLVEKNPTLFTDMTNNAVYIKKLIRNGEHDKLEFKSTLRTNVYTKEVDRQMEHSVLKTIVAYLNSEGGTLLVGVSDAGEILGIEKDGFKSNDRFYLYFTNLLKQYIGNDFIPFIKFRLVKVDDNTILKVDCMKSNRQVFLRFNNNEEFYMRMGPSSIKIAGSKMLAYVRRRFRH